MAATPTLTATRYALGLAAAFPTHGLIGRHLPVAESGGGHLRSQHKEHRHTQGRRAQAQTALSVSSVESLTV